MKKSVFAIFSLLLAMLIAVSCDTIQDSNTPIDVRVLVYKGDKVLCYISSEECRKFRKDFTFRAETKDNAQNPIVKEGEMGELRLPLMLDVDKEEFVLKVFYKDKKVFEKELQLQYKQIGRPFKSVVKQSYKDHNGEWQPFVSEKLEILDDNEQPTGYQWQMDIPVRK